MAIEQSCDATVRVVQSTLYQRVLHNVIRQRRNEQYVTQECFATAPDRTISGTVGAISRRSKIDALLLAARCS